MEAPLDVPCRTTVAKARSPLRAVRQATLPTNRTLSNRLMTIVPINVAFAIGVGTDHLDPWLRPAAAQALCAKVGLNKP